MPPVLTRYIIAVKREMRSCVPVDWQDQILEMDGIFLAGNRNNRVVMVDATAQGIKAVSNELGEYLHIEAEIPHHPS